MDSANVNISVDEFLPETSSATNSMAKKPKQNHGKKRPISDDGLEQMQIDEVSGIEGKPKNDSMHKTKRQKYTNTEIRKVAVPSHRYSALKENWLKIFTPIVEHLQLQIRFNMRGKQVEIRPSPDTADIANLQKAADFVKAFILGFDVDDSLALLRLDDLFIETFQVKDVKTLHGDHESRAIGRMVGKGGRTKFTIENVTKTRLVIANERIHILGSYQNIQLARRAICNLILGSPPSKVYGNLRSIAARVSERI